MPIVKMHNKKTGITYVYESESYWDKEKQQPRNRRKLIGKIDPVTGAIVPTGKAGRKPTSADPDLLPQVGSTEPEASASHTNLSSSLEEKNAEIKELRKKMKELESKCEHYEIVLQRIRAMIGDE